ncbi:MAG: hypothetical protein KGY70_20070 [Bacteroidales bacterium]|nr:hypothetical protein [Bacteroidales bacterium]
MENKRKHLEFIQNTINRMVHGSFLMKSINVFMVSVLLIIGVIKNENQVIFLIGFLPVIVFWILDGFFLYQERLFRTLYDEVRMKNQDEIDFSMDTKRFRGGRQSWWSSFWSGALWPFHGVLFLVVLIITLLAHYGIF